MPLRALLTVLTIAIGFLSWPVVSTVRAQEAPPMSELVQAELIAEKTAIAPGGSVWVGVRLRMKAHWHTYWRNPGDTGLPTEINWSLPDGFKAGPIQWPVPSRMPYADLMNYGYENEVTLISRISAPVDFKAASGPVMLKADVSWLVCEKQCIPGDTTLEIALQPAALGEAGGAASEETKSIFAAARSSLPTPMPWPIDISVAGGNVVVGVAARDIGDAGLPEDGERKVYFFPHQRELIDHGGEQRAAWTEAGLEIKVKPHAYHEGEEVKVQSGVLVIEERVGERTVQQALALGEDNRPDVLAASDVGSVSGTGDGAGVPGSQPSATGAGGLPGGGLSILGAMLLAVAGGIILNLMPCVLPVLSLKLMGFAQQAGENSRAIRLHGLAYAGGVLAAFAVLAVLLIALRSAGEDIGWGFQLQSPIVVAALAYGLMALGLSFSGVVHFGSSLTAIAGRYGGQDGLSGSFVTGLLAAVVASPCTAPFMGTAVGFALTQPGIVGVAVILCLGLGLALPVLMISLFPSWVRLMPKPGAWMETLKQALAFPLYATVAWLMWVLSQQVGASDLLLAAIGLVVVALGVWALGLTQSGMSGMARTTALATSASALAISLALIGGLSSVEVPSASAVVREGVRSVGEGQYPTEPFSQQRLGELRAAGKPVFVEMTAAWCITCLVNKKTSLSQPSVRDAFAAADVTYLIGDWTNRDRAITKVLEAHGHGGVPLYLLYGSSGEPEILPQILTPGIVLEAVQRKLGVPQAGAPQLQRAGG